MRAGAANSRSGYCRSAAASARQALTERVGPSAVCTVSVAPLRQFMRSTDIESRFPASNKAVIPVISPGGNRAARKEIVATARGQCQHFAAGRLQHAGDDALVFGTRYSEHVAETPGK